MTCEQDEGDQWTSVGIVKGKGEELLALVVLNNDDDESKKLETTFIVEKAETSDGNVVFFDSPGLFRLITKPDTVVEGLKGDLLLPEEEGDGLFVEDMNCFADSEIEFDGEIPNAPTKDADSKLVMLDTELTCRQEDGDQVRSIGIVQRGARGNKTFEALIVDEDFDATPTSTKKLVQTLPVTRRTISQGVVEWSGKSQNASLKLTVKTESQGKMVGELVASDAAETLSGLECISNDTITFDK
jgi:hypothetical protein